MKRSELAPGMPVEIRKGIEYPRFWDAVVLSFEPWEDRYSLGRRSPASRFRAVQSGDCVPVAKYLPPRGDRKYPDHDDEWVPDVVHLAHIVPVGSRAAWEAGVETTQPDPRPVSSPSRPTERTETNNMSALIEADGP